MSEHNEAVAFAQWLNIKGLSFWHPVQENPGSRENGKVKWGRISKLKAEGWAKGMADYLIYIPSEKSAFHKSLNLWVELKKPRTRKKNGEHKAMSSDGIKVYPEQEDFIDKMNTVESTQGEVCYGADHASEFVEQFLA